MTPARSITSPEAALAREMLSVTDQAFTEEQLLHTPFPVGKNPTVFPSPKPSIITISTDGQ